MNDEAERKREGGALSVPGPDEADRARAVDDANSSAPRRRRSAAADSQASTLAGDPSTEETLPGVESDEAEGELSAGQILGEHYRVEKRIGRGAMGAVYVVEHLGLGKRFAAKVVSAARASDTNAVRRLRTEARTLSAIEHENIVTVTHLGQTGDGRLFVVMELLEGEDLGARMLAQRTLAARGEAPPWLPDAEVGHYVPQLLSALTAAHQAQVVHRDLKPDNLFLAKKRGKLVLKVVDFGISKMKQLEDAPSLTQTGQILGTPLYMAPEQGKSTAQVDARADLYSFGCILHEMLTGQPPFIADGVYDCIVKHATETPNAPSISRPGLSPELDAIVLRCLQKKPGNRFANAEEILEAFTEAWSHGPTTSEVSGERPKLPAAGSESAILDASLTESSHALAGVSALSTASNEPVAQGRGSRWRVAIGAGLLLALAGGFYLTTNAGPATDTQPPTTPPPATQPSATQPPATPSYPDPATPIQPPNAGDQATGDQATGDQATGNQASAPVVAEVHLRTSPAGVAVYFMGELLGHTPLSVPMPSSGQRIVELAKSGYRMRHATLRSDQPDPAIVRMRSIRRTAPALAPR
ncbi:MAG: protein kinase [Deltaproteobacteria bacterium]|nr:protein kinase [Deltaproteobacteria bacterium]